MNAFYPLGNSEDMSEGEYQYQLALCDNAGQEDMEPLPETPNGYWRVRSGATLEICKMSTEHLKNAIEYFTKIGKSNHMKILELCLELDRRTK